MKRFGFWCTLNLCVSLLILFAARTGSAAPAVPGGTTKTTAVDPLHYPVLELPNDSTVFLCSQGDSICYMLKAHDVDSGDSIKVILLSGPIAWAPTVYGNDIALPICFVADTSGDYRFIWRIHDLVGRSIIDTVDFFVTVGVKPSIADQNFTTEMCWGVNYREVPMIYSDSGLDAVTFTLLSGAGTVDAQTGLLEYTVDTAGTYVFQVEISGGCGADTATITDVITINKPPYFTTDDQTVKLCDSAAVCVNLTGVDPEGGAIHFTLLEGGGEVVQTENGWQLCFSPQNLPHATYQFIVCLQDDCPTEPGTAIPRATPLCVEDTLYVTVDINAPPVLTCPGEQLFSGCNPKSYCYSVSYTDAEDNPVVLTVLSGNAVVDGQSICVIPGELTEFDVVIEARDECGADTCTTHVRIEGNRPPTVITGVDQNLTLCAPETICLDAFVNDPNLDIANVFSNIGTYNPQTSKVCFTPDTAGVYTIIVTAVDSCGAEDMDTTVVTVALNEMPTLSLGDDQIIKVCDAGPEGYQVCVPVATTDEGPLTITSTLGAYDPINHRMCFNVTQSGEYMVIGFATDDCNAKATDTVMINITLGHPPTIAVNDDSLYLCFPQPVCFPVTINDVDNDIASVTVSKGKYENGQVCFVPYDSGTYKIAITVTDKCGTAVTDTLRVKVRTDQNVVLNCPKDTSIFLCEPDTLCFPFSGFPDDADLELTGVGVWYDKAKGAICFYSDCCLENIITAKVTTLCGYEFTCSFKVRVQTNSKPLVILPNDTTMRGCDVEGICLPVGISDIDNNIVNVTTGFGTYDAYLRQVCFTPDTVGTYQITVVATDACGLTGSDVINVVVKGNTPPTIAIQFPEGPISECVTEPICLPVTILDEDANIRNVVIKGGTYNPETHLLCFTPDTAGTYCLEMRVTDSCGAQATAQGCVTVKKDGPVNIACTEQIRQFSLCGADSICFPVEITGNNVTVTTNCCSIVDGQFCFYADTSGIYSFLITAYNDCDTATCLQVVKVDIANPPVLTCPVDTTVALCATDTLCFPLNVSGDNVNVTVSAPAYYNAGQVCVPVLGLGEQTIQIIAANQCGADTCQFTVTSTVNEPPVISGDDATVPQCVLSEICVPFTVSDPNNGKFTVTTSLGHIRGLGESAKPTSSSNTMVSDDFAMRNNTPEVCFTPDHFGAFQIILTAIDSCGAKDEDTLVVTVNKLDSVSISLNGEIVPQTLCSGPDSICIPVTITGNPAVTVNYGELRNNNLCFLADSTGTYTITAFAAGPCNTDTLSYSVHVTNTIPVEVTCQATDTAITVCSFPVTFRFPLNITGTVGSVSVLPLDAVLGPNNSYIDVTAAREGAIEVRVVAENACSTDTCGFVVTVKGNTAPQITLGKDTTVIACQLVPVCVPLAVTDIDGNLTEISSSRGVISNDSVCFTAPGFGTFDIVVRATDACGLVSTDTVLITLEQGPVAHIDCPVGTIGITMTLPDSARVPLTITPPNVPVTVLPSGRYDAATGQLVVYVETEGVHTFTVIAAGECGSDTCEVSLEVNRYNPPLVQCIGSVDTALCLVGPTTLCLPVTVSGTSINVSVSPIGTYADGSVCFTADSAGTYIIRIIAANETEADTCYSTAVVTRGRAPQVNLGEDFSLNLCQAQLVCVPLTITGAEFDVTTVFSNIGYVSVDSGKACFMADSSGTYRLIVTAGDNCGNSSSDTVYVTVNLNRAPVVTLPADFAQRMCGEGTVCFDVSAVDNNLTSVVTSLGTYDPETHKVCFAPTGSGLYTAVVTAVDSCGIEDKDTINITVTNNTAPQITDLRDTTIYLCAPQSVCIPVTIADADFNPATVTVSRGSYSDGKICFIPYDSGLYQIVVTAIDSCGLSDVDTVDVRIKTDQNITLVCPRDTSIFVCQPETLCFPVGGIPAGANVTLTGTNVWWNAQNQTVCFFSDCCLENTIGVKVTTPCGTYQCSFTVKVQTNSKPLVIAPKDTTLLQCAPTSICLPVGISDVDKNITNVTAIGGTWDSYRSQVCVTPTGEGAYPVIITATDACGLTGTDTVVVTIHLNKKPVITFTSADTIYTQCTPQQICVPIGIADPDGNLLDVNTFGLSTYNAQNGTLCFTPTGTGRFCLPIKVTDKCGSTDSISVCITVNPGNTVDITCPTELPLATLCAPSQVCVPLAITGQGYTVSTSLGSFADGQLCFNADSSGTYTIRVIAAAQCNADTCFVVKQVKILEPVEITCPGNQTLFLCATDTLCYPFTVSPSVTNVTVSGGAYLSGNTVCVPLLTAGPRAIILIASGACSADTCSFTVNATFNAPPVVTFGNDTTITACALNQICLPFTLTDVNGNIATVTPSVGVISGGKLCFTPTGYGVVDIILTAVDSCGAKDDDTVRVTYNLGGTAVIPPYDGVQYTSICGPTTVCLPFPTITPANATITITPAGVTYNPATHQICIPVTSGGSKAIRVIASAPCGADTCDFTLQVTMNQPPVVTCPGTIDTLMCLAAPTNLCFPVTVTGSGVNVTVQPIGTYSAGVVCLPVSAAGTYNLKIIASGVCGVDTCDTKVIVRENQKPTLTLPTEGLTFQRCPDDVDEICIGGIVAHDAESPVTITKVCGPGQYTSARADSGSLCFTPTDIGTFNFCFQVTDGCNTVTDTLTVIINAKPDCDVCARFTIDAGVCSPVGLRKTAAIKIETNDPIGGFDLLLSYDASALAFQSATITGTDIQGWEYFTWKLNNGGCGTACPSGLIRLVGIADRNNGSAHPPDSTFNPNGVIVLLDFQIFNDQTLGDQFVPIRWVWYDCADNTLSNPSGTILYADQRIFTYEGNLVWDETDDVHYPEAARPFGTGSPDECFVGSDKAAPLRCIEFYHGGICIIHPDSIDDRGDINLNGLAYEIADAVLFTSYFIKGLSVFTESIPGQVAATDVTNDGLTLTVADLAYLIRVIVGDAQPIPKLNPYADPAQVTMTRNGNSLVVSTETVSDVGIAWLTFDLGANTDIGQPFVGADAQGMDLIYSVENGQVKMLLYNIGHNRIAAGKNRILEIPLLGDGEVTLSRAEMTDYDGRVYMTSAATTLPTEYSLSQNFPNPFNPSTTISFRLPQAADWNLTVYNITGGLVRSYSGSSAAGNVDVIWDGRTDDGTETASGIYLYRFDAGSFSQTRKMVLLK